jgi:hypothetical protein
LLGETLLMEQVLAERALVQSALRRNRTSP